jgi:putative ABC transport system permease protein
MYIPYQETPYTDAGYFILRTRNAPLSYVADARTILHQLDPDLPITQIRSMREVVSSSVKDWRFHATLLGIFAALALIIAAIGVYGVISYSMAQRTHEIGIRMALGAQRSDVMRLVLKQGAQLALGGIIAGVLVAFGLTRLLASMLYGVRPTDPATFAGVAILLLLVALLACYIPARRAMRVDPMIALRYE